MDAIIYERQSTCAWVGARAPTRALLAPVMGASLGRAHMTGRSRSSDRWLREHFADPFVKKAQAAGWCSRAVFKLEEIDRREHLFKPGQTVLDLGAAPGARSQYARRRVGRKGRVIAWDILAMDPLAGVDFVLGDFREEAILEQIRALTGRGSVDVVLSDMAPNMSGMDAIDQPRAMHLAALALETAGRVLKQGGSALIKTLQGAGFQELVAAARQRFERVRCLKPEASRARSPETYLLASGARMV